MPSALRPQSTASKEAIRAKALELGFDAVGFASADHRVGTAERLRTFLARGWHGDMDWMAETAARRAAPRGLWPGARGIVMLGVNYAPGEDPMARLGRRDRGVISVYAWNRDYHDLVKKRLKRLGRWMAETYGCELKVFVDTAPVMEKPLAQNAGIGWQGKHTNLVSRDLGSWFFLGAVYTTLDLPPDDSEPDNCGSCRNCLDVCPTNAFPAPYQLDARRCISYLTIEHKGHIPNEFRPAMGNRIYGCDDCLAVCPWNKFAAKARESAFHARNELTAPRLADLVRLDDAGFRTLFSGSPVKRLKRDRFVRNVLIAIGNSRDAALAAGVESVLKDPSPLVRAMAVWALGQLADGAAFAGLRERHLADEPNPAVTAEWRAIWS